MSALELRGVDKAFGAVLALDGIDLRIEPGELVTLLGPSGSGKTTLLNVVAGFVAPSTGEVILRGRDISRMSPAQRDVGMVFQHYALFPHMTVAGNIGYGLRVRRRPKAERERRVAEMLELLHLSGYGERYPRQLSGGEQQRVALGRALVYDPEIVLMDEPLGALDRALRTEMEAEIRRLHRDLGATILYVTHDQQEALALSDRVAIMRGGRIVGAGTPEDLYERPASAFVASFFANANLLPVESYELVGKDARVRCAGQELECAAPGSLSGQVALAVRGRTLRTVAPAHSLALSGVVAESRLLGDERQAILDVPGVGRVVALLDARESRAMETGALLDLYVAWDDVVLVSDDVRAGHASASLWEPA
ncbi:MAG: ABC transporter ATP-binding protein [Actinomycetota bacterium]|nr:ABC transporter ATP-binding protein [Actinomycetota bacterium]